MRLWENITASIYAKNCSSLAGLRMPRELAINHTLQLLSSRNVLLTLCWQLLVLGASVAEQEARLDIPAAVSGGEICLVVCKASSCLQVPVWKRALIVPSWLYQ